jgi:hypothetical protein
LRDSARLPFDIRVAAWILSDHDGQSVRVKEKDFLSKFDRWSQLPSTRLCRDLPMRAKVNRERVKAQLGWFSAEEKSRIFAEKSALEDESSSCSDEQIDHAWKKDVDCLLESDG